MRGSLVVCSTSFAMRSPSGRKVRMIAAMMEPEIDPSPPNTTMATTSNDLMNMNMVGLRYIM